MSMQFAECASFGKTAFGATPMGDSVKKIADIIAKTMMPAVLTAHKVDQKHLNEAACTLCGLVILWSLKTTYTKYDHVRIARHFCADLSPGGGNHLAYRALQWLFRDVSRGFVDIFNRFAKVLPESVQHRRSKTEDEMPEKHAIGHTVEGIN